MNTIRTLKDVELYKVQVCLDMGLFQRNELNRVIDGDEARRDLFKLTKRMKLVGFPIIFAIHCVLDGEKLRIVDGHRRFHVARQLGVPVPFIAFREDDEITPLEYSIGQRSWTAKDFAQSHAATSQEYREVLAFAKETGMPARAAFALFGGEIASSANRAEAIREGRYRIRDRELPQKVALLAARVDASSVGKFGFSIGCLTALSKISVTPGVDLDDLNSRISGHRQLLAPCRTVDDYIEMFEGVYNYTRRNGKFPLKWEVQEEMRNRQATFNKKDGSDMAGAEAA